MKKNLIMFGIIAALLIGTLIGYFVQLPQERSSEIVLPDPIASYQNQEKVTFILVQAVKDREGDFTLGYYHFDGRHEPELLFQYDLKNVEPQFYSLKTWEIGDGSLHLLLEKNERKLGTRIFAIMTIVFFVSAVKSFLKK